MKMYVILNLVRETATYSTVVIVNIYVQGELISRLYLVLDNRLISYAKLRSLHIVTCTCLNICQ